ncbi:unnamed protein product [Ostreobium quekettii]|uniref:Uncharacterized protein n=1 Tax=Ostreobium quekettii TaxID=121088 RepID=A0A8S1J1C6_9CHLO|nr:unnamed protein product [Ostreobium quekettii]|eukprot:evm.model.scf_38EXC.7 EVM.evm.TU.scf_38EXC.7   scf_38EXC:84690-85743(-)
MAEPRVKALVTPLALPDGPGFFAPSENSLRRRGDAGLDPQASPGTVRSLESASSSVEDFVRESLASLEERLEGVLDCMSEELSGEVSRERQHLLLMQEQVDKQGRMLQHEFGEIHKAIEQERTARALVQQGARERGDKISANLSAIARELEEMRTLVSRVAVAESSEGWLTRLANSVWLLFRQCTADRSYTSLPSS